MNQPNFTDDTGQSWTLHLGPRTAGRQKESGRDLNDRNYLIGLVDDPIGQFDLIFGLIEDQARDHGIDENEFERRTTEAWPEIIRTLIETLAAYLTRMGQPSLGESLRQATAAKQRLEQSALDRIQGEAGRRFTESMIDEAGRKLDEALAIATPSEDS